MNLIGQTKIWQIMEVTRPVWNSKYHIFQILQPIRKPGYWRIYCSFQREGDFQTIHTKKTQAFRHQNVQTLWLDWIHVWHEIMPGKWQKAHSTASDSNPCVSDRTEVEDRRKWPQITHGQFSFFHWIMWWFCEESDLLLLYCQAEPEKNATRPKTEENNTAKGRHSRQNQGWLDGNTVGGQERRMHVN